MLDFFLFFVLFHLILFIYFLPIYLFIYFCVYFMFSFSFLFLGHLVCRIQVFFVNRLFFLLLIGFMKFHEALSVVIFVLIAIVRLFGSSGSGDASFPVL